MEKTENSFLTTPTSDEGQKWIIVGFDPGLTVGIAIMDLFGNIISIKSCKEMSRGEIIRHIISYGKAIIIATDVYPAPKMAKKLASALNSKIYSPSKLLSVSSKIELVESYINEIKTSKYPENAHERDSLAAAIKTYKHYQNKFELIEKRTEELDLSSEEVDDIKAEVIRGRPITSAINDALMDENPQDELESQIEEIEKDIEHLDEEKIKNIEKTARKLKQKIKSQEKQIKNLKDRNKGLKKEVDKQKKDISKLKEKIDKLHYQYSKDILLKKEISSKVAIIKSLQEKYTHEKALREKLEDNMQSMKKIRVMELSKKGIPLKIIESFTREGIKNACEYWKIKKGDLVLLSGTEGGGSQTASLIIHLGVKAVIAADKMSHPAEEEFEKNMVPVLDLNNLNIQIIDEFAVIEESILNREIEKWRKDVEARRKIEEENKLLKVIDEYRAQRRRG